MKHRFAVLCLPAMLFFCRMGAQPACTIQFTAHVVERHSGLPLFPATLYLNNSGQGYEADDAGHMHIDGLCAGHYTWIIKAEGSSIDTGSFDLVRDTTIVILLSYEAQSLQQVTVRQDRLSTVLQSKESLGAIQLAEGTGKSLGHLLGGISGVNTYTNGGTIAKPVIHGLRSNRILTLNNGIRQEDQQWGDEHAPNIDPFLASNVTVLKGAAGVRYGADAIGGVILVMPAALLNKPGWDGEFNMVAFSNNRMGVLEGMVQHAFKSVPGLAFRLQGTVKRGGNYRIPGYRVANTGVVETNFSATLGYKRAHQSIEVFYSHFDTELGLYRGSHTGSREDLLSAINSDTPRVSAGFTYAIGRPKQNVVHDLIKVKLNADTRAGKLDATYAFQHNYRQEYDVVRIDDGKAQLNLTLNTHTINLNLDHKPLNHLSGQLGVDGIYQHNFFADGDRLFIPNYTSDGVGAYAIERWKDKGWVAEGGLRYDYRYFDVVNYEGTNQQAVHYQYAYNSLSGTLGVSRKVSSVFDWSATLATAWRAPQASELFSAGFHQGAARIELGNKNLQPERAYGLNVTGKWANGKVNADLGIYSQYIGNYIFLEPGSDLLTIRGYFKSFAYRQTNAWLNGADLTASYQWTAWLQSVFKGSFLLARDVRTSDWLIQMPQDRIALSTRYSCSLSKHMSECYVELSGKYAFRQTRIPGNFDSIDYPRPPAGYFLLDAAVGSTIHLGKQPLQMSLAVENALNARYREYLDAFRYFIDQPGTNIILRLKIPFNNNN
jgi:iron complex outermembrane receptor protein